MALVSKILEQTLPVGSTAVTFTDADIPNSLIRVFSSNPDIIPVSRTLINNTLTVTYEAQAAALDVAVEIVKSGFEIVDNVLSEDTDKALSAKQGYLLNAAIGDNADNIQTLSDNLDTLTDTVNNLDIPDNITDLDDVTVTNIQSGQVLAWDGTKFVNVNQSGGVGGIDYSTTEQDTGLKWTDGKTVYQKVIPYTLSGSGGTETVDSTLSNIDKIISIEGIYNSTDNTFRPLTFVYPYVVSSNLRYSSGVSYNKTTNKFEIYRTNDIASLCKDLNIIVRYTKTV